MRDGCMLAVTLLMIGAYAAPAEVQGRQDDDASSLGEYHARWGLPDSPGGKRLGHLLEAMARGDDAFTRTFVQTAMAPAFRDQFPIETHVDVIQGTGADLGDFELADVMRDPSGIRAEVVGTETLGIAMQVAHDPPYLITSLGFQPGEGNAPGVGDESTSGCGEHAVYSELDFWLGTWAVSAAGMRQGTNRIESVLGGCAVIEHWTDVHGGSGKSLFYVDPVEGRWKQVWVTGQAWDPEGGVFEKELVPREGSTFVFEGDIGGDLSARSRTTLTPLQDGTVRQLIERSNDAGSTWSTTFDAVYERTEEGESLARPANRPAESSSLTARLADIAAQAARRGVSGQILAIRDGVPVFETAFGTLTGTVGDPLITSESVFAIGSITKQFTRVAILALEQDGRLSRSDRLGDLLPDVPTDRAEITVDQLLTMRAGFHEYHDDTGDHQGMTRDEAFARIMAQPLRFEPGTDRAYSNSGFTLLAMIVEEVSGQAFAEYVRERLLDPLGLDRVGFHGDNRWADGGVAQGLGGIAFGTNTPDAWPAPTWALQGAGGMVASARDLSRWILALRGGEVLEPAQLEAAYPGPDAFYAGGDDYGFVTAVVEIDGGRTHVITATNSGGRASEDAAHAMIQAMTRPPISF